MPSNAFLKLDGIKGESLDSDHKDELEVESYNFGITLPAMGIGTGGGRAAGRADFQDFSISKRVDASSPVIYLNCIKGTVLKSALLTVCAASGDRRPIMKIAMSEVSITGVQPNGSGGNELPSESVSFSYGTIKWTYTQRDEAGAAKGDIASGWDLIGWKSL